MWYLLLACASVAAPSPSPSAALAEAYPDRPAPIPAAGPGQAVAVFAGGCFWCMESDFDTLAGVVATTSGFAGGHVKDPTYDQVSGHGTGHLESVRVVYDTRTLTYEKVLDWYWRHVDPTDAGGQFCDRGEPYHTGVFPQDAEQARIAAASKAALDAAHTLPSPVATTIFPVGTPFYAAENEHQDFHETNPAHYNAYRLGCGRDARVKQLWGG